MSRFGSVTWPRNPSSGDLDPSYIATDPDMSYRIASEFQLESPQEFEVVTHISGSPEMIAWRYASTKHKYVSFFGVRGGQPPYRVTMLQAPMSATWGGLGRVQVFNRAASSQNHSKYTHSRPDDFCEIQWQPADIDNGTTFGFKILVEDSTGNTLVHNFSVQVNDSVFTYFSSTGSDSGAGTFEDPWLTFAKGYTTAGGQNRIHCYGDGTYIVHNGTPNNNAAFDSAHCASHIGIGENVVFDMSSGHFSGGVRGITLQNLLVVGGRSDQSNVRLINFTNNVSFLNLYKVQGRIDSAGTVANDNPTVLFITDLTSPLYHENISIAKCKLLAGSQASFSTVFQVKNLLVDNFIADEVISSRSGAMAFHLKDGTKDVTFRFSDITASMPDGLMWISSQDWASCGNVLIHHCRFKNIRAGASGYTVRWNGQVITGSRPSGYSIQHCSIDGYQTFPAFFESYVDGDDVMYSANLYSTTRAGGFTGGSSGGVAGAITTLSVADIDSVSDENLGLRGHVIASTLVS